MQFTFGKKTRNFFGKTRKNNRNVHLKGLNLNLEP